MIISHFIPVGSIFSPKKIFYLNSSSYLDFQNQGSETEITMMTAIVSAHPCFESSADIPFHFIAIIEFIHMPLVI